MSGKIIRIDDTVRLFQLYLLSVMRVNPLVLNRALTRLASSPGEMDEVRQLMKGRGFQTIGGPPVEFYREMLGQPTSEEVINNETIPEVFHGSKALRFKLSLWPDFDFVVNELPDGGTFDSCFRRSKNVSVPPLTNFSELKSWQYVKEEVYARFGPPQFGDAWDSWEEVYYMISLSPGEPPRKCLVMFDFNLLQSASCEALDEVD